MRRLIFACLGAVVFGACGGGALPVATPPASSSSREQPAVPPTAEDTAAKMPFQAQATGPTEDQAYQAASQRLLVALLNEESLAQDDPVNTLLAHSVHDRGADAYEQEPIDGQILVRIGLAEEQIDSALSRLSETLPQIALPHLPRALRQAIVDLHVAHLQSVLCKRAEQLLDTSSCPPQALAPALGVLSSLAEQVRLEPQFEEGVPTSNGRFIRPLVVSARMAELGRDVPLERMPLRVQIGEQEAVPVIADERGVVVQELPKELSPDSQLRVAVNAPALLGRFADEVEFSELKTKGRGIGLQRAALLFDPSALAQRETAEELRRALVRTVTQAPQLSATQEARLRRLTPRQWKKSLPALADEFGGTLDVLLYLEAESEFASRMGTHRVWFEARGSLTAVNVWTGEELGQVSTVVTESGVGEVRAERAARQALGALLGLKLQEELVLSPIEVPTKK